MNNPFISNNDLKLLEEIYKNKTQKKIIKISKGYPIQYLIGYVDFCGYKILVNKNVLIPRFETELLTDKIIKIILKKKLKNLKVLEIGTGSGCISICLKKEIPTLELTAVDISKKALNLAQKNANLNNVNIKFVKKDIKKYNEDSYDIIISNPPYISFNEKISKTVSKYEPKKALYAKKDGLYFYELIIKKSLKLLNKKGIIAFEIGANQGTKIINIVKKYYSNAKIILEKDFNNRERYIFIYIE